MSFEDWNLRTWGRWLPRRHDEGTTDMSPGDTTSGGLGETIIAMRREREIHARLLVEMDRRGPEVTADDLYDEMAAEWDRAHAAPSGSEPAAVDMASVSGGGTPRWADELLAEQRETNRLLRALLERLEQRPLE